jgi:hypothetical protein
MDITKIKREPLPAGTILKISFYVWYKILPACLKIALLAFLCAFSALTLWLVFVPSSKNMLVSVAAALTFAFLLFVYIILILSTLRAAYDFLNTKTPSVADLLEKSFIALPKMFAAVAAAVAVFFILTRLNYSGGIISFAVYGLVLSVWCASIILYLGFYVMAVLFRGSGSLKTFKYTFLLLKNKWAAAFFKTLSGFLICCALYAVAAIVSIIILYCCFPSSISDAFATANAIGPLVLFAGIKILAPAILFLTANIVFAALTTAFLSSYMSILFLNTELSQEADPAEDKIELSPQRASDGLHEFTEFFNNASAQAIDITERLPADTTMPAIAPAGRAAVLREFKREEEASIEDISEADREEDDILEVLSELKKPSPKPKKRDKDLPSSIISE